MDVRKAILDHMNRQGINTYRVMKELNGRVPQSTLYGFLRGEHPVNSDALGEIITAVGLTVTPSQKGSKWTGPR